MPNALPDSDPRILLYAHDSFGLGHLRRTLTLAAALAEALPRASLLIASGSACATHFELPPRTDVLKLPCVGKVAGAYTPRSLPASLDAVIALRRALLETAAESFAPDLIVVDHQAIGLRGEMLGVLEAARGRGAATILGVRDVIDAPEVVAREWGTPAVRRALTELYDRVCVYGSPGVFDARARYAVPPELAARMEFTGYVVRPPSPARARPLPTVRPQVVVTMGGGEDGEQRLDDYLAAIGPRRAPWDTVLVLGPLLDRGAARRLKQKGRSIPGVTVHTFHHDMPRLLSESDAVVAMAGYNTVAEILQSGLPAVLLPRTMPRVEQLLRARELERLGLARCLVDPEPRELRAAVASAVSQTRSPRITPPLDGATVFAQRAAELLGAVRLVAGRVSA